MADDEIIKALECCGKNPPICIECSYKGKCNRKDCYDYLKGDALSLINRQTAEIERLTKCRKEEVEKLMSAIDEVITEAKSDAIKELAEKLKEKSNKLELVCSGELVKTDYTITGYELDNLVKEMVGDNNG